MNRVDFEKKLQAEGYGEMVDRQMEADHFNPEHAHEFDACVLVVDGEMTIARDGKPETFARRRHVHDGGGDACIPSNAARRARITSPDGASRPGGELTRGLFRRHPAVSELRLCREREPCCPGSRNSDTAGLASVRVLGSGLIAPRCPE